eukprot:3480610-Rhodomonas_salina.3
MVRGEERRDGEAKQVEERRRRGAEEVTGGCGGGEKRRGGRRDAGSGKHASLAAAHLLQGERCDAGLRAVKW